MSGAVLGVTLLAGLATLGASVFIVKGDNKELLERKADEAFAKSKLPYDFSLNRDGIERLRNLKGPLLMQAIKDPRMDSDRISRMTDAEFEELARSSEDVPLLLKESSEVKMREIIERLFTVLKSGKGGMASGKVIAWVLMIHRDGATLLEGDFKLHFSEAVAALIEMYTDAAFKYKDRCRGALTECILKKTDEVGPRAVENDAFLRAFPDNRAVARLMSFMDNKNTTQLANIHVVKNQLFDETDLLFLMGKLQPGTTTYKFMKENYMQRFSARMNVEKRYKLDAAGKFTARVGASGANVNAEGKIIDDRIEKVSIGVVNDDDNTVTITDPLPTPKVTITVQRAFEYKDTFNIEVSR